MANSKSSHHFVVLSSGVTASEDVFNNLVLVRDKETGEEGTLLCAHMCHFPSELILQATWLEGCKTPEKYKDESRLALGYHPNEYTQWKVDKEANEIEIYLTGGWSNPETGDQFGDVDGDQHTWLNCGLTVPTQCFNSFRGNMRRINLSQYRHLFKKSLIRLFERMFRNVELDQVQLDLMESTIHRLYNAGRISAWEATVFPYWFFIVILRGGDNFNFHDIHWEGHPSMFLGEGLEAFADGGVYSNDNSIIPYIRNEEGLLITSTNIEAGFQRPMQCYVEFDEEGITYGDPSNLRRHIPYID